MDEMIKIDGLTKDYGQGRGVFDIGLSVKEGEVFGLVGINGSGKTTMIRHLMGFLNPQKGRTSIMGKDCWKHSAELMQHIGYIPGEIAFPDIGTGTDFFKLQAQYHSVKDMSVVKDLTERFNLDPTAKLKRMSKGMKQKTAIVNAFMSDAKILLLDEGSTGLDPLMQSEFTELVKEQKRKGKTVFMSSHMFDELESTCDRVAFLKDGHIIDVVDMSTIRGNETVKEYKIEFEIKAGYLDFLTRPFNISRRQERYNQVTIHIPDSDINNMFSVLSGIEVKYITQIPRTLESYFMDKYINSEVA